MLFFLIGIGIIGIDWNTQTVCLLLYKALQRFVK